jgi:hypothetical protein
VHAIAIASPITESVSARGRPIFPLPMPPPPRPTSLPIHYNNVNEIGGFSSVPGLGGTRFTGDGPVAFLCVEVE